MTTLDTINVKWLRDYMRSVGVNDENQLNSVRDFVFMWSLFEGLLCNTHAGFDCFVKISKSVANVMGVEDSLAPHLDYFRMRYVTNGATNSKFEGLSFRSDDQSDMVTNFLLGNEVDLEKQILSLLLITYRLRNNLFHGVKKIAQIGSQQTIFTNANAVLRIIIITSGKYQVLG